MSRIKFKCKFTSYGVFLRFGRNASDMRLRRHILARINRMRRPGDAKRPSPRVYWLRAGSQPRQPIGTMYTPSFLR